MANIDNRTPTLIDDARWSQLRAREAAGFLYGVTTMGIFCQAGCPSRLPNRGNVRIFTSIAQAEADGFRACRRCYPKGERARLAQDVVRDACTFIETEEQIPSLEALATRSGYSRFHFLRMFKDHTGLTPRSYAEGVRARRLQQSLARGTRVADAVLDAGFGSESRVYENTAGLLGMTPGSARRGAAGETIRIAFADSAFGRLLVGATDKGVCFIGFAEPDEALLGDLKHRFPNARVVEDTNGLAATLETVVDFIKEPHQALDLPLDLRGTAFQLRVWQALRRIPPGETRTYADLARMIGNPKAVRAVARGCATNPVSLAVPCHRVIGKDGTLTGYRCGFQRKHALLAGEGAK